VGGARTDHLSTPERTAKQAMK